MNRSNVFITSFCVVFLILILRMETFGESRSIISSGNLDIPQTWTVDLDKGELGAKADTDIWFEADTATLRYITPRNGAKLAVLEESMPDLESCKAAFFTGDRISVRDVSVGTWLCIKTNQGRYSRIRINAPVGPSPGTLNISYTTWEKRGNLSLTTTPPPPAPSSPPFSVSILGGQYRLPSGADNQTLIRFVQTYPEVDTLVTQKPCNITDISALTDMEHLTGLILNGCEHVSDLSPLPQIDGLKKLILPRSDSMSDLSPIKELSGLVDLSLPPTTTDVMLAELMAHLPHLERLYLESCNKITDLSPLTGLPKLTYLDLHFVHNVEDISSLAQLTQLEYLRLLGTRVSDLSPLSNLINLKTIFLWENRYLMDISPIANLTNLEFLGLIDCDLVTDIRPLEKLIHLKGLALIGCDNISPEQIEALKSALPNCKIELGRQQRTPTPQVSPTPQADPRSQAGPTQFVIWTTALSWNGNLGGLAGADAKCAADVNRPAGLTNHIAVISTSTVDARDRVPGFGSTQVVDKGGQIVDLSWDGLWDGVLSGGRGPDMWTRSPCRTGTQADGTAAQGKTCTDYTSSDGVAPCIGGCHKSIC